MKTWFIISGIISVVGWLFLMWYWGKGYTRKFSDTDFKIAEEEFAEKHKDRECLMGLELLCKGPLKPPTRDGYCFRCVDWLIENKPRDHAKGFWPGYWLGKMTEKAEELGRDAAS